MGRKSVKIAEILRWVNIRMGIPSSTHRLPDGITPEQAFRLGQASLLEQVLHHTGNYEGFGYLEEANGEIRYLQGPFVHGTTDETRRTYYVHPTLRPDYEAAEARAHTQVR